MKAVVKFEGKQLTVEVGKKYIVNNIKDSQVGDVINLNQVLMTVDGNGATEIGKPHLNHRSVTAEVLKKFRGDKIIICKKNRRKGYQRKRGFRPECSLIKVTSIA